MRSDRCPEKLRLYTSIDVADPRTWFSYSPPWPLEERCEWCFGIHQWEKHRATWVVRLAEHSVVRLCTCCWFTLAESDARSLVA